MDLENILDHEKNESDDFYYKKSKKNLLYSVGLIVLTFVIISVAGEFDLLTDTFYALAGILYLIAIGYNIVGFINGVKSYLKKEITSSGRIFVLLIHSLIVGFFLFILIQNFLDLARAVG